MQHLFQARQGFRFKIKLFILICLFKRKSMLSLHPVFKKYSLLWHAFAK